MLVAKEFGIAEVSQCVQRHGSLLLGALSSNRSPRFADSKPTARALFQPSRRDSRIREGARAIERTRKSLRRQRSLFVTSNAASIAATDSPAPCIASR